jgi:hypothetical protein
MQSNIKSHSSYASVVTRDGSERGCTNNDAAQGNILHADLGRNMYACSEKFVARPITGKTALISSDQYARVRREFEIGGPSDQRNIFSAKDSIFAPRTAEHQYKTANFRDIKNFEIGGPFNQRKIFPHECREFAPRVAVWQYRPRFSGGRMIRSVAPGTKPGPQWCPAGLTHTQKWRVQRLRTLEIREEMAKKRHDERFNRDKPVVPMQIWREKRIAAEENKTADETLANDRVTDVDDDLAPQKT